jgi:hypothetical protein
LAWILIPLVNFSLFPGGSEASAMVWIWFRCGLFPKGSQVRSLVPSEVMLEGSGGGGVTFHRGDLVGSVGSV